MIIVSGCLILTAVNLIVLKRMVYKTERSIVTFDIGLHEVSTDGRKGVRSS